MTAELSSPVQVIHAFSHSAYTDTEGPDAPGRGGVGSYPPLSRTSTLTLTDSLEVWRWRPM
jgi:hypothetical protein